MQFISKICIILLMTGLCMQAFAQQADSSGNTANTTNVDNVVVAGKIDLMEGDVKVYDANQSPKSLHVGDSVNQGDSIVTGANGELHMTMADEAFIAVRPNTKMRITLYRANGDDKDKGVIGLLVGSLRSVTGWIGKYQPKSYSIRTPTATIGIRGTDHEPTVIPEGSSDGEAGTYDKVNTGGSFIKTPQGSVDVTPQHAGYVSRNGTGRPHLLDKIPTFFRPTKNEHLIDGKHEQIQRIVAQRREERHQAVRQRFGDKLKQLREKRQMNGRRGLGLGQGRLRKLDAEQRPNLRNLKEPGEQKGFGARKELGAKEPGAKKEMNRNCLRKKDCEKSKQ